MFDSSVDARVEKIRARVGKRQSVRPESSMLTLDELAEALQCTLSLLQALVPLCVEAVATVTDDAL